MKLNDFLSDYSGRNDYRQPLLDLLAAATHALNAYADTAGKPNLTYVVQSRTADYGATAVDVQEMYTQGSMRKGQD